MKFCMECGQKAPPVAKFCPGCGNSMSLSNKARVKEDDDTHELPEGEIKDIKLPEGVITISGEVGEELTVEGVLRTTPEGYRAQEVNRPRDRTFSGLNKDELARKLTRVNRSDGSKEA